MRRNDRRRIPPLAEDAFEVLTDRFDEGDDGFSRDTAFDLLEEGDFVEDDAEYAVEQLLLRGYLYEVDDELFVTPTD